MTDDVAGEPFGGEACDGNRGRQQQANLDLKHARRAVLLQFSCSPNDTVAAIGVCWHNVCQYVEFGDRSITRGAGHRANGRILQAHISHGLRPVL
jgi:hypothetical protein